MVEPLQFSSLHTSQHWMVCDVSCRAPAHGYQGAAEKAAGTHTLAFVRRGVFAKSVNGADFLADANHVVFFNRGEAYQIAHPIAGGDDCTVLQLAPELVAEVAAHLWPESSHDPARPFLFTHARCDESTHLLLQRLRQRLQRAPLDELAGHELILALTAATLRAAAIGKHPLTPGRVRAGTGNAHRQIAEATQLILAQTFSRSLGLVEIARLVHCSPFHLARIFRAHAGVTLHQYRNRLRLREALRRVCDGELDLARLAIETGFSSHSHLSDCFRRGFGTSPSVCRRVATRERLREMSKNLEAGAIGSAYIEA